MTLARNTAEGQPSGTTLTISNSGGTSGGTSGDAFGALSSPAPVYSNARAKRGSQSFLVTSAASSTVFAGLIRPANDALAVALDVNLTALPTTSANAIAQLRTASTAAVALNVSTDGRFQVTVGSTTLAQSAANTVPLNQWIHADLRVVKGATGTGDGTVAWNITSPSATTLLTGSTTTASTGTAQFTELRWGKLTSAAAQGDTYFDDLSADDGQLNLIGEAPLTAAANAAPISTTANPGAWTATGVSDLATALADSNDATWVQSPDGPSTPATLRMRLAPLVTPDTLTLTVSHQVTTTVPGTAKVTLYQGATAKKTWALSPTTTLASTTLTMTSAETATITDFSALDVELSWGP